jgi:molybdenum cofactor cytidylyltransferase
MKNSEPSPKIAAILLAAGGATRMGQPKLLLPWKGEALIHRAARVALQAGLLPVIIVSGAGTEGIHSALKDLPVQFAHNPIWQEGQSTSVRAGVEALPADCQAVVFLLGDQPFVGADLIQTLVTTYIKDRPTILAPHVNGKRVNPVIFDRSVFPHLLDLKGDAGARSIFGVFPPAAMPWPDEKVLLDIDTPDDYAALSKLSD